MTFSLELSDDVIHVRDWVHEFAVEVVRPAAAEWDEREETPWPIIQEAAKVGLYSMELFATQVAEPSGLGMLTVFEEMFWGDAGIALSILGTGLAAASLAANGTPEQIGEWLPADVRHPRRTQARRRSARRSPARAPTSAPSSPAPATTRPPTSGFSTAPRPGPPTAASPTSTSSSRRCIPNWARAGRPRSSSRRAPQGFSQGQKFKKHGIRASHTAEVVLDDVRIPGPADRRRQGEVRRADRSGARRPQLRGPGRDEDVRAHPAHRRRDGARRGTRRLRVRAGLRAAARAVRPQDRRFPGHRRSSSPT